MIFSNIVRAFLLFFMASLAEIGGGYLVWQWLRNGKPLWLGIAGGFILFLYGVVATFQVFSFGKSYASYGGVFIVMALLWGWMIDKRTPDLNEWLGSLVCLVGVAIILWKR